MDNECGTSFCLVGPAGSGKSSFLGTLLYSLGGISGREKDRLTKEAGEKNWAAWYSMRTKREREIGHSIVPCYRQVFFDESRCSCTLMDLPGENKYVRNFHRGLFAVNEAVLVVRGDQTPMKWEDDLFWKVKACMALERRPVACVVTHMDVEGSNFVSTCAAVARVLARNGIFTSALTPWKPEYHHVYPATFRASILQFLLINRFSLLPTLPKDVIKIIVGFAAPLSDEKAARFRFLSHHNNAQKILETVDVFSSLCKAQVTWLQTDPAMVALSNQEPLFPIMESYKIGGIGHVVVGRMVQGSLKPGETHPTVGIWDEANKVKMFSFEHHHQVVAKTVPPGFFGINIKGGPSLVRAINLRGGVMGSVKTVSEFTARVHFVSKGRYPPKGRELLIYNAFSRYYCRITSVESNVPQSEGVLQFKVLTKQAFLLNHGELSLLLSYEDQPPYHISFTGKVISTTVEEM